MRRAALRFVLFGVAYRSSDLIGILDEHMGKLDLRGELAPYKRLKARLEAINRDSRYAFMFGSLTVQDTMAQVLSRLFRIPVNGKPIAILELGGLPSEIINVVVSVLARLAFDFGVWSAGRIPITFVCEEAHRYVPVDKTLGFEPTKRAISRIAKEGRKYGISLALLTQRPSELDTTILSQCSTILAMRLATESDQRVMRANVHDSTFGILEYLPLLADREAIVLGRGAPMPMRIKFHELPATILPGRARTSSPSAGPPPTLTARCWKTRSRAGAGLGDGLAQFVQQRRVTITFYACFPTSSRVRVRP